MSASAWSSVAMSNVSISLSGFSGSGVSDGKYLYFGSNTGVVARYDSSQSLSSPAAWTSFDVSTLNAVAGEFGTSVYDGRYIYFSSWRGTPNSLLTRFDTTLPFTTASSWSILDLSTINSQIYNTDGMIFDGRKMYLIPNLTTTFSVLDLVPLQSGVSLKLSSITSDGRTYSNLGPSFQIVTTAGSYTAYSTKRLDSNWHMISGVYDGQSVQLYIDGSLSSSQFA